MILFGAGGVAVEVMDDTAIALPPLDDVLARDLIERTRIGRLLAGFRDRKPADQAAIAAALNGLSQMIVDFPCIVAMDINPLLADAEGVIALDARIEIEPEDGRSAGTEPGARDPALSAEWDRRITLDGNGLSHPTDQAGRYRALSGLPCEGVARGCAAALPCAAQGLLRRDAQAADPARL